MWFCIFSEIAFLKNIPENTWQQIFERVRLDKRNQWVVMHFLGIIVARIQSTYGSQWLDPALHNWRSLWFLAIIGENCIDSIRGLSISNLFLEQSVRVEDLAWLCIVILDRSPASKESIKFFNHFPCLFEVWDHKKKFDLNILWKNQPKISPTTPNGWKNTHIQWLILGIYKKYWLKWK